MSANNPQSAPAWPIRNSISLHPWRQTLAQSTMTLYSIELLSALRAVAPWVYTLHVAYQHTGFIYNVLTSDGCDVHDFVPVLLYT